jgi:iron complex outermembrane recepter protein
LRAVACTPRLAGHRMTRALSTMVALYLAITCSAQQPSPPTHLASADTQDLKHLSLEELGNIEIVSATKEPTAVSEVPAAIFVITQQDIERSGATSIADALRLAPGVEVARISSTTFAIGIRGLQSNFSKSVLVLIDGRSVYTPLFAGTYWDVQDLILEDVERIEVIRGPGGTIWGPNAVNGVVNIITKHTRDTHGVLASAHVGNVETGGGEFRYGGGNGALHYRVFAKGFVRSHEFHQDGNNFDEWHHQRGGFRMDLDQGRDSFMAQGDIYGGNSPHLIGTEVADDSASGGNILLGWRRALANGSILYLRTYFDRTIRTGVQLGETRNTFDVDVVHHWRTSERNMLSYGGGLRWSPNRFVQKQPGIDILPHDLTEHTYTAFLQDEMRFLSNKLALTGGIKLQHNNFSGFDVQPTLRLLFKPRQSQSFWAAVTRAVTTPSRIEEGFLLSSRVSPDLEIRVTGNPDFQSEALIGYEGGYRQMIGKHLFLDLTVFHNDYQDLQSFGAQQVTFENAPPPPHLRISIPYTNAIAGSTNGFEISPSWQIGPWWQLSGSYSFVGIDLHANEPTSDISSTGSVRTYEESTPQHQMTLLSKINLPKNFTFDQRFRAASGLPAQTVDAYSTLDLQFAWEYRSQLRIAIVGQNLFQPQHEEWGTGDPSQQNIGIRRGAYVKITWTRD